MRGGGTAGVCMYVSITHTTTNYQTACACADKSSPVQRARVSRTQEHSNEDLYEKAVSILETYFECEEGEEPALAPAQAGGQYAFGAAQPAQPGGFDFGGSGGGAAAAAPGGGAGFSFQGFGGQQ